MRGYGRGMSGRDEWDMENECKKRERGKEEIKAELYDNHMISPEFGQRRLKHEAC